MGHLQPIALLENSKGSPDLHVNVFTFAHLNSVCSTELELGALVTLFSGLYVRLSDLSTRRPL